MGLAIRFHRQSSRPCPDELNFSLAHRAGCRVVEGRGAIRRCGT